MTLIIILILLLYARTFWYHNLIDDICERKHYLTTFTQEVGPDEAFCDKRRHWSYPTQCIIIFIATCWVIYLLWGWRAAVLYAVLPNNVVGVAWKIGSWYMSSIFLLLTAHYFLVNVPYGAYIAAVFYYVSLVSTVTPLFYPFVAIILFPRIDTLILFIPLVLFLTSKRFRGGVAKRKKEHLVNQHIAEAGRWTWKRIIVMVKTVGYYICFNVKPDRDAFFHEGGYYLHNYRIDRYFWGMLAVVILFSVWAIPLDWRMWLWYMGAVMLYSNYFILGMFLASRYQLAWNVAWCVLMAQFLPYNLFIIYATLCFCMAHWQVKMWRNNLVLFSASNTNHPDCPENINNYVSYMFNHKLYHLCLQPLLTYLKLCPYDNANIRLNLAQCYYRTGRFGDALTHGELALEHCAEEDKGRIGDFLRDVRGQLYRMQEQKKELRKRGLM